MKLLLDTHALLWALVDPDRLQPDARAAIENGRNEVLVSAASLWEISIKQVSGKLQAPEDVLLALGSAHIETLSISGEHAIVAGRLPPHHADPFDRMLIAQASIERLTIVTRDPIFGAYGVPVLVA